MQDIPVDGSARTVIRHSWSSTQVLRQWYASHSAWPYPSATEKEELSRRSGLSIRQISQWFVNARRRDTERQPSELSGSSGNPISASLPTSFALKHEQSGKLKTDDRRHRSSSSGAIPQVVTRDDLDAIDSQDERPVDATAISSSCSSYSRESDQASRHHRKDRLAGLRQIAVDGLAEEKGARIYQCTFCTDTFKSRYDWTRHEGTLHLALERWTCLPNGPKRWDAGDEAPKCSLCDSCDPTDAHLEAHHMPDCIMKPSSLRTFHRKDHLLQHLRLAHDIHKVTPSMNSWKSKILEVKSRCGFCGETFSLWSERNDHLVDHFRRGESMKSWKGDRGLEPSVAMLVQSAMPPYLIGNESLDLEPFSASKGVLKKALMSPETQKPPNVFEVLTARLGDFVTTARTNGDTINCDILRRQARLILYGDDDPLNQTPADNDQWLTLFKIGHGLPSQPSQQQLGHPLADEAPRPATSPRRATMAQPNTNKSVTTNKASGSKVVSKLTKSEIYEGAESKLPWWCQTPECLAEIWQMSQEFSLTSLGNIEIGGESARDSES
ncbi:hypothetical protein V8C35DRAFT_164511 [Trichoderma chlorosporum]